MGYGKFGKYYGLVIDTNTQKAEIRLAGDFRIGISTSDIKAYITSTGCISTTSDIYVGEEGKVGIGTTQPNDKLEVAGGIRVDDYIRARDSGGLALKTDDGKTRLAIIDDGKVGIGVIPSIAEPFGKLIVCSDDQASLVVRPSDNTHSPGILFERANESCIWNIYTTPGSADGDLRISGGLAGYPEDLTDYITITKLGRVGIGTVNPGAKLAVSGGCAIGTVYEETEVENGVLIVFSKVGIGTTNPSENLDINGNIHIGTNSIVHSITKYYEEVRGSNKWIKWEVPSGKIDLMLQIGEDHPAILEYDEDKLDHIKIIPGAGYNVEFFENSPNAGKKVIVWGDILVGTDTAMGARINVDGGIRADAFIEYSKIYRGDALSIISRIKCKEIKAGGNWVDVDYNSLPVDVKWVRKYKISDGTKTYTKEEVVNALDLGKMIKLNMRAIQQLTKLVVEQRIKIIELEERVKCLERGTKYEGPVSTLTPIAILTSPITKNATGIEIGKVFIPIFILGGLIYAIKRILEYLKK